MDGLDSIVDAVDMLAEHFAKEAPEIELAVKEARQGLVAVNELIESVKVLMYEFHGHPSYPEELDVVRALGKIRAKQRTAST